MSDTFNPYHRWLGIPPKDQPPDHYRLLGVERFECDREVIRDASERQIAHVRRYASGKHADLANRLLNELATARACLLNAASKAAYDQQLRDQIAEQNPPPVSSPTPAITLPSRQLSRGRAQSPRVEIVKIVVGGMAGLAIGVLLLWYGFGIDVLGVMKSPDELAANPLPPSDDLLVPPVSPPLSTKAASGADDQSDGSEQELDTVLSSLRSSTILRMTFDRETVVQDGDMLSVKDLSGLNHHGAIHGATVVPGVVGEALSFVGQSEVDCGNAPSLQPGGAFSISVWAYPIHGPEYPRIVSKFGTYELRWQSYASDPGPLRFEGVYGNLRAGRTPPYEKWHHLVVTFGTRDEGGELRMYLNGAFLAAQRTGQPSAGDPDGHLYLGVRNVSHHLEHYQGLIDELTILNRELTEREVEAVFRATAQYMEVVPGAADE
jgi:Concanavalin A-like lectin/glucanases superfamily